MSSHNDENTPIRTGITDQLILPSENRADYLSLLAGVQAEYQPETQQHRLFVEQLAISHWLLIRRQRTYIAIETAVYESAGNDPEALTEEHFRLLALAERYKLAAERALQRALKNAELIRKQRNAERDRGERHARWRSQHELRARQVAAAEGKRNPAATNRTRNLKSAEEAAPAPRQWPDKIVGLPVPKEVRDEALARAQKIWDRTSGKG